MVTIRLSRAGRINKPLYTLVVTDSRSPRDGKFLEKLGQYDPQATEVFKGLKAERLQYWVSKGARYSDKIQSLFKRYKIKVG